MLSKLLKMGLFNRTIHFFLIVFCILIILVECKQELQVDEQKVKQKRQTEIPISSYYQFYEKQQQHNQNQFNFRPNPQHLAPSFTGYSSPPAPLTHSRGGLILPANNQIHAISFLSNQQPYSASSGSYQPRINDNFLLSKPITKITTELPFKNIIKTNISNTNKQQDHFIRSSANKEVKNQRSDLEGSIELALRQTNGDESVFQPSPPLETSHEQQTHFDWNSSQETIQQQNSYIENNNNTHNNHNQALYGQTESSNYYQATATTAAPTTTTTEHNNNIVVLQNEISTKENQLDSNNDGQQQNHLTKQQQQQQGTHNDSSQQTSLFLNSNQSLTLDINNQVTYEGPATAPSVGDGYYFSSSERLPQNELKSSNAWWAIGFGHEFELASNLTTNNYMDYCSKSELLINNKQRSLCKTHYKIIPIVARGLKLAIDECQARFSKNRWNCSLAIQQESFSSALQQQQQQSKGNQNNNVQVFGELMKQPIRERSFLNAIIAAALAHTMTKACSQGELPEECSCDKRIRSRTNNSKNKVEWVACSDDIDYGAKFSRDFTDNTEYDSDTTSMINIHNYEVGRRVLKSLTDITCTCQNGENGLCQTKKCWKHLGQFSDIGDELMKRYESATHVQLSNKDPHKLRPVRRGVRKPKRKDLVFIDESPDYCNQDTRLGVLGTQNRHCNSTSLEQDSCSLLCCGRGYQVVVEEVEEDCNCKFVWCCQVRCDKCNKQITYDICN